MQYNARMPSNTRKPLQLTILAFVIALLPAAAALAGSAGAGRASHEPPAPTASNYVIFDPVKLPAHGQVPVWCPAGYVPQLVLRQDRPSRKGFVQCVATAAPPPAATATALPPLQSPIGTPTPSLGEAPLPTMPTYSN
jgi:hypothetical protein